MFSLLSSFYHQHHRNGPECVGLIHPIAISFYFFSEWAEKVTGGVEGMRVTRSIKGAAIYLPPGSKLSIEVVMTPLLKPSSESLSSSSSFSSFFSPSFQSQGWMLQVTSLYSCAGDECDLQAELLVGNLVSDLRADLEVLIL